MDSMYVVIILMTLIGVAVILGVAYLLLGGAGARTTELRGLMSPGRGGAPGAPPHSRLNRAGAVDPFDVSVEDIKKRSTGTMKGKSEDISVKLFRAGFFTAADRKWFLRFRMIVFGVVITVLPLCIVLFFGQGILLPASVALGGIIGFTGPMMWLERQIKLRHEETLYFLPLVVEQISIGVSSALDIGPCISHIVQMANDRDTHNPVTEMFVHVEKLMRSGLSLEDGLLEVAEANGSMEIKHAMMFLSQCAKHGGEVSKQLQELADSVMVQRQVQIEGKIAALPVKATGPLSMVFAGFFALVFAGLLVRVTGLFGPQG